MQTDLFLQSIYITLLIAHIGILLMLWMGRTAQRNKEWLASAIGVSMIVLLIQLLPADTEYVGRVTRDYAIWLALIGTVVIVGGLIIHDVARPGMLEQVQRSWLIIGGVWFVAFAVTALLFDPVFVGWSGWTDTISPVPAAIGTVGVIAYAIYSLGLTFYFFYVAPMPEVANRAAFWVVTMGLLLAGAGLIASGTVLFMVAGNILLWLAMAIAVHGIRNYRVPDVRDSVIALTQTATVVAIGWALIFATLYFMSTTPIVDDLFDTSAGAGILVLALTALVIATLIVPARYIIKLLFDRIMMRSRPNLASATAQYSQRVARAATLEEVVNATTETLNRVMGVKRSALILVNNTVRVQDSIELVVLEMGATLSNPSGVGYLHEKSPIYHTLAVRSVPLGQYDIDYGPAYQKVSPQEKAFFRDLKMSAYVPVSADNRLIGLLASGPKVNDTSYYREDVELLSVIGQQVGTALRSARLIDDLQHLNDSMRVLNKRLEGAKVELEKLDTIKTDFITIASHELRTPLAQIRGYTDILDSLNKSNALKEGQADQLVNNLRKSTERMEELISAMLDVSQIDVNSMDLRFIRTSAETISKMALEPLRDPADERNIEIIRHSAKDLPNIEADLQRMVQALRNIVLNAIKFTPDGGKIEISAELEKAEADGKPDSVVFKIKDSGVGIDKKDIPYIFNKFYRAFDTQLHSSGIYKFMGAGPGLGLTIAKGIIEGHGGSIWAESERHDMNEPPGTTFYVRIPLEPPSGTRRVSPFEEERAVKS
ncbi:MAG: ATP-binding protein [Chloroflexota bacterium]